jgi:hypothetical protein
MTVIARVINSVPQRSADDTWTKIVSLLAPAHDSASHRELISIAGIAGSLIARESMTEPIIVFGSGPRVRIRCLYNEDALAGDGASEAALPTNPTAGDWNMSLPCPKEDLTWISNALAKKSSRITAREMGIAVDDETGESSTKSAVTINKEAFLNL